MILYHVFPCGCKDEFVCWAARDSDLQGVREDVGLYQGTQTASLLAAHAVNTDQCILNADFAVIEKDESLILQARGIYTLFPPYM